MMTLKYIVYNIYKFQDRGASRLFAYESAIGVITIMILVNVISLIRLLGIDGFFQFEEGGASRVRNWLYTIVLLGPPYLLLSLAFKKREIQAMSDDQPMRGKARIIWWSYLVLSVAVFLVSVKVKEILYLIELHAHK
jgi:hypothetical protein